MTERDPKFVERFESFLDDVLSDGDKERVQKEVDQDVYWSAQADLQNRIDDAARSLYSPPEDFNIVLPELSDDNSKRTVSLGSSDAAKTRWPYAAMVAIVASIAWLAVALNLFRTDSGRDVFNAVELTKVYATCVDEGFQPYWVCDDDAIFATTFSRRQGVPLELKGMPNDVEMVGLSYLAGISRRSTGMLATVAGEKVIVFVDRDDRDWKPKTGFFREENLYVLRMEKFGLVFYEVTPFSEMRVTPFFRKSDRQVKETIQRGQAS